MHALNPTIRRMPKRMIVLDVFCGGGGASMGYHRAGFDVVGVDIHPQPYYPFAFFQRDALRVLTDHAFVAQFDLIHASPPCQSKTTLRHLWDTVHPDLIGPTRELLKATGKPYVIENVPGAQLIDPIILCGSMFGLGANGRQLRRHREFESNMTLVLDRECQHEGQPVGVYGYGGGGDMNNGSYKGTRAEYHEAMGIDWGTKTMIAQAIPPAYTEYTGRQLLRALNPT